MDPNTFPTKGNLILAKNSLALSRQGFELMDKKRNILIREMMELIDQAKDIQAQIDETFICTAGFLYCPCGRFCEDQDTQRYGN